MSWISNLFGVGGNAAAQPIEAVGNVLDKLFTSDEEKLDKKALLQKLAMAPTMVQAEINKIEAAHRSVFVAGWRPFIGWVCGSALAYHYIIRDLVSWALALWSPDTTPPPDLAMEHLLTLLGGLLGLGTLRTFEKTKKISK